MIKEKEIKLTADELEAIKDDVRFRENITLQMKYLKGGVDEMNKTIDCLKNLKGWVTAHTWAIGVLFTLVLLAIGMCMR